MSCCRLVGWRKGSAFVLRVPEEAKDELRVGRYVGEDVAGYVSRNECTW